MSSNVPLYGFGGGSDNLKFRVYSATSLPASGKENDVCIITSTPISVWEVYPHSPTWESDNGHVYIKNEPAYGGEYPNVNVVKKNAIWLYLVKCRQYENGTWVNKDAYQYRNGAWVQFSTTFSATIHITYPSGLTCTATHGTTTLTAPDTSGTWDLQVTETGTWVIKLSNGFYEPLDLSPSINDYTVDKWHIYKDGNHYNDLTGGFVEYQSFNAGGSHNLNDSDLTITRNAGGTYRIKAVNLIDLTKFTALQMIGSVVSGSRGGCFLKVFNSSGSEICSTELNAAADITSLSGKYIVVISADGSLSDPSCTYSIKKIQAT